MKIEKINDNQIKFILSKSDLSDRDLKFSELEYGSEKTQELFHEMMEQASTEYGFKSENAPLMIEAIPMTTDSMMIIVTKISNLKELDTKLNMFTSNVLGNVTERSQLERYKLKGDDLSYPKSSSSRNNVIIYYFNRLNEIINVAKKLNGVFIGHSSVFKYTNQYYLVLESTEDIQKANYILSEYGQKLISNIKSKYHLMEHGEIITKERALEKYNSI